MVDLARLPRRQIRKICNINNADPAGLWIRKIRKISAGWLASQPLLLLLLRLPLLVVLLLLLRLLLLLLLLLLLPLQLLGSG